MRQASSVTSTGCVREAVCVKVFVFVVAVDSIVDSAVDDACNKARRSVLPFISSDRFIAVLSYQLGRGMKWIYPFYVLSELDQSWMQWELLQWTCMFTLNQNTVKY
jgi:hypothetical protein